MFSDLAVAHGVPVRRWVPLVSFSLQACLVSVALVYPLLRLEPLPELPHPVSLPIFSQAPSVRPQGTVSHGGSGRFTAPMVVSQRAFSFHPATNTSHGENPDPMPILDPGSGPGTSTQPFVGSYPPVMPTTPHQEQRLRTSVMMEGNLIHKVEPQYPALAKQLRIEGSVIVKAWIDREGVIERAQVESGHPLLARAALEAVRQWRYRPYYLNHEPVEVETEVTVNFVLQR